MCLRASTLHSKEKKIEKLPPLPKKNKVRETKENKNSPKIHSFCFAQTDKICIFAADLSFINIMSNVIS